MKVYYIRLDDAVSLDVLTPYFSLLPAERQEKIVRYRFEEDKLTSAVAGLLIGAVTGFRELIFNEHGKPYVKDAADCFFSLSHSGRCVAIAVDAEEVGLDVEKLREKDTEKLRHRFFSIEENRYIEAQSDQNVAFTDIWTRKEAYLKMKGTGITDDLTAFDTTDHKLMKHLVTYPLEGYYLTVCSVHKITSQDVDISEIELKDLIRMLS